MVIEMGLNSEFLLEESGDMLGEFQRNMGIFQRIFDDYPNKNAENLGLVDLILEVFRQRTKKPMPLNHAVIDDMYWGIRDDRVWRSWRIYSN